MILAPYPVLGGFVLGTVLVINLGLAWMVWPGPVGALFRRLLPGDAVALWLGFFAAYHAWYFVAGPYGAALGDPTGVWVLWGALGWYAVLRAVPWPQPLAAHRLTALLAAMLALWGWVIGAGYAYLEGMEADRRLLADRPAAVLEQAPPPAALERARFFSGMDPAHRDLLHEVLRQQRRSGGLDDATRSLAETELLPALVELYDLERRRLGTYQFFQIAMLAGLLLAWGFGVHPRDAAG